MSHSRHYGKVRRVINHLSPIEHRAVVADKTVDLHALAKKAMTPREKEALDTMIAKAHAGQGSATRGWSILSPKPGSERHELHQRCGDQCFLDPDNLKYPVCTQDCHYNCAGLHSAYSRAIQNHHDDMH